MTDFYKHFKFNIIDFKGATDACAKFIYNGFEISFSTIGRSQGGCPNHVCIFGGEDFDTVVKGNLCTVQEAIEYIDLYA